MLNTTNVAEPINSLPRSEVLRGILEAKKRLDELKAEFDASESQRVIDHPWLMGFLPFMPLLPPIPQGPEFHSDGKKISPSR